MMKEGYLELVLGPMFAGKSTKLIELYNRYKHIVRNKNQILVVNHPIDTRYGEEVISTHNQNQLPCRYFNKLDELYDKDEYTKAKIIIIEESQFYENLEDFVNMAVNIHKKHLIVGGLISDYKMKPFGDILKLIPMCDEIIHLKAFCKMCNDGTLANFSKRLTDERAQIMVGSDEYVPVCRKHFHQNGKVSQSSVKE